MAGHVRTIAAIAAAAALGLGLSVAYFGNDPSAPERPDAGSDPAEDRQPAPARPPPETFAPVFEPCAHCHQVGAGARHASGPELNGIVGDPAAARDYPYSAAMRDSGLVWDEDTLVTFLVDPYGLVPGTRMLFEGMPRDRAEAIVDYLKSVDAGPSPPAPADARDVPPT